MSAETTNWSYGCGSAGALVVDQEQVITGDQEQVLAGLLTGNLEQIDICQLRNRVNIGRLRHSLGNRRDVGQEGQLRNSLGN